MVEKAHPMTPGEVLEWIVPRFPSRAETTTTLTSSALESSLPTRSSSGLRPARCWRRSRVRHRSGAGLRDRGPPRGPALRRGRRTGPSARWRRLSGSGRARRSGAVPPLPRRASGPARARDTRRSSRPRAAHGPHPPMRWRIPSISGTRRASSAASARGWGPDAGGWSRRRGDRALARPGRPIRRPDDRPHHDLRRPGRDRDPERAALPGSPAAQQGARPLGR